MAELEEPLIGEVPVATTKKECLPEEYTDELKEWWAIVWPTIIFSFASQSQTFVDLSYLGHLEYGEHHATDYLAASSCAGILFELTLVIFTRGMIQVLSVLCSQAYGSGNFMLMGKWLQSCVFVSLTMSVPVAVMWWYADVILSSTIGVEDRLKPLIRTFSRLSIMRIFPQIITQATNKFCISQKIILPLVYISVFSVGCNILLNDFFIYKLGFGFEGSPLATTTTAILSCVCTVLYVFYYRQDIRQDTWPGLSLSTMLNRDRLRVILKQGMPLTLATCLEDFQVQLISSFAVTLSKTGGTWIIATHNGLLTFFLTASTFQYGTMGGTSVRCAHHIGNQDKVRAKIVVKIALVVSCCAGFVIALIFIFGKSFIPHLYSNDPKVWEGTKELLLPVGMGYFFMCIFFISMATLDAQGRPLVVAISFFVGAWLVGVPFAYLEAFVWNGGLRGIWYAIIAGYVTTAVLVSTGVLRSNWDHVLECARERNELGSPRVVSRRNTLSSPCST